MILLNTIHMKKILFLVGIFLFIGGAMSFAQPNANAGKIWTFGNNLFINSPQKGVQVMDNSNPERPQSVGFVAIPGNVDFAVFGSLMYANHFDDLVLFDWEAYIHDRELIEIARFEGLFPEHAAQDDMMASMSIGMIPSRVQASTAQGGSMACFSFDNPSSPQYLYAANRNNIHIIDVSDEDRPQQKQSVSINGSEVETIFVQDKRLFLGMPDGMMMYSLDNPELPSREGHYRHMVGCDPVVAQGNRAYVTVRSGSTCNSTMPLNQLHIVDVNNSNSLNRAGSFQLAEPHGLGIDGNLLFICDGKAGVKVLDVTNPTGIRLLNNTKTSGVAYDVIVQADKRRLIVVSGDNIVQFQYTATGQLNRLGEFKLDYSFKD